MATMVARMHLNVTLYVTLAAFFIFRRNLLPQKIENAAQRDLICLFIKFTSVLIIRLTKFNALCLRQSTHWFIKYRCSTK